MQDKDKTGDELINELENLRQRVSELEKSEATLKETEQLLREGEERYLVLLENLNEGIFVVKDGVLKFVNSRAIEFTGFSADELTSRPFLDFVHPDDREMVIQRHMSRMAGDDTPYEYTMRIVDRDGNINWLLVMSRVIPWHGERAALVSATDITRRKQAEEQIGKAEEFLDAVVDNLPIAVFAKSAQNGQFILWNKASEALFGFTGEQVIGKTDYDFFPKEQADYFWEKDRQSFASGVIIDIPEEPILTKNSGTRMLHTRKVPVYDKDGPSCLLAISQDITERKHAEKALQESESQKQAILDGITTNIAFVNEDLEIIWLNKTAADSVGKLPSQMIGHRCHEFWANPDKPCDGCPTVKAFKTKQSEHTTIVTPDGRVWDEKGEPVFDDAGRLIGVVEIAQDITDRKRAEDGLRESEEALRTSEAQLSNAVAMAHLGHWEYDVAEDLFTFNDQFYKIFRTTAEEVGGHKMSSADYTRRFVYPDEISVVADETRKAIETDDPSFTRQLEHRMLYADGEVGHISVRFFIVKDKLGRTVKTYGVNQDITQRKRAEQALKDSETRYRRLFEAAKDGILILDADTAGIVDVNPSLTELLGYSHEELLQKKLWEIGIFEDTLKCENLFVDLRSKEYARYDELSLQKKDGSSVEVEFVSNVYQVNGNKVIQCNLRDVTDRKRLERQLLQSQKMEAVGFLAGGVAHDFNNLLTVIQGYSELLLLEMDENAPGYADLRKIHEAGRRGAELVQNLLAFSRKAEIKLRPINLNREVVKIEKLLRRTIPKMIKIELYLDSDLAAVNADAGQIGQILMNLAVNAEQAMPDGGKLTISTTNVFLDEEYCRSYHETQPGRYVLLTVEDTGHGMGKETLEHIFEPFFTTKGVGRGTGLGLAMVYGILRQHGGHITCYSEPGHGTTFKIYLPAITEAETERRAELEQVPPRGGTETILLADDEDFMRDLGQTFLSRAGYTVLTATSGPEALQLYLREGDRISLMILDLIMPEMGGDKCLDEILAINPDAKIVISSGAAIEGKKKEIMESGAKGFLSKPFRLREMLKAVRQALDSE